MSDLYLCKSCKYWDTESEDAPLDLGLCKAAKMLWDCTEWGDEESDYMRVYIEKFKDVKLFLQDGSDYNAFLLTKGDFGCNEFKNRIET